MTYILFCVDEKLFRDRMPGETVENQKKVGQYEANSALVILLIVNYIVKLAR